MMDCRYSYRHDPFLPIFQCQCIFLFVPDTAVHIALSEESKEELFSIVSFDYFLTPSLVTAL